MALRTQQVIAHETGVTDTIDPLGGSFFIEAMTDRMERQAYDYFRQIDSFGGVIKAIEAGFFQREIDNQRRIKGVVSSSCSIKLPTALTSSRLGT